MHGNEHGNLKKIKCKENYDFFLVYAFQISALIFFFYCSLYFVVKNMLSSSVSEKRERFQI